MLRKTSFSGRIDLALFTFFFILYTSLGSYLSLVKQYLPYDSLSRLVSAWLVWNGAQTKLATIGFVWPPLPTLSILPLALFPALVKSWVAVVIVSAFFMAISVVLISKILGICNVNGLWRWLLAILFGLNPLNVVFGVNGMSEAMLVAACLAAFYTLIQFWNTNRSMHLVISAVFFGLLPLIRYEFALLSAAAGVLLLIQCWEQRPFLTPPAFRDFLEGRLLAFSSMAIYPIFLWSIASWMIMGNPIYFLVNDRSATSLAGQQFAGFGASPFLPSLSTVFSAWSVAFPASLVATAVLIFLAWKKHSMKYLGFVWISYLVPTLQFVMLLQQTTIPLLRYFMTSAMFGCILVALAIQALQKEYRLSGLQYKFVTLAAVLAILGSNFATLYTLNTYPYQGIESQTWRGLTTSDTIYDQYFKEAFEIGKFLPGLIKPGQRILIDTYQFGFGIMLGANDAKIFMDFTDPNYDKAVMNPVPYADYVLVPNATGRGALYSINRWFPYLHDNGAPWATLVEGLPDSNGKWKLYKVNKP